jgi:hypothetical protein
MGESISDNINCNFKKYFSIVANYAVQIAWNTSEQVFFPIVLLMRNMDLNMIQDE